MGDLAQRVKELSRPGVGHCDAVVHDDATGLNSLSCYSPPITLRPGQVSYLPGLSITPACQMNEVTSCVKDAASLTSLVVQHVSIL